MSGMSFSVMGWGGGGGMPVPVQVKDKLDQVSPLTVRRVLEFLNNKSSILLWCGVRSYLLSLKPLIFSDIYSNSQV